MSDKTKQTSGELKNILNFLIEVGKLKRKKRRGWLVHQIKNSESTAEHIFRTTIMSWFLGKRKEFNIEKTLKMALVHDLCEVYSPDLTPYDPLLPKNLKDKKKIKEILKFWPKLSLLQKRKRIENKKQQEIKGLEKLINKLPFNLRKEIWSLWIDFEKGLSAEARFVKQVDKLENLLQGLEYWRKYGKIQKKLWIRWIKENLDDPILIEFLSVLEEKFSQKKEKKKIKKNQAKFSEELDFFIEIGKLKTMPRKGWVIREIKNPETIAEHIFRTTIMSWFLAVKKRGFNIKKIIKMSLIHDLCEVYTGDISSYDSILPKNKNKLRELMETWPRFSKLEKRKRISEEYKKETKGLKRLISKLPLNLKREIKNLWIDYRKKLTKEARFFYQIDRVENFLQALEYWKKYKSSPGPWWIEIREVLTDSLLLEFVNELDKKFFRKNG